MDGIWTEYGWNDVKMSDDIKQSVFFCSDTLVSAIYETETIFFLKPPDLAP